MDVGLHEKTLRRIIALLVSFAGLAERAAGRSLPVRWFVLTILRHAEGVALGYLAETTWLDWSSCFADDPQAGSRPDDAAALAWRFRALAALLGALLPPDDRFDDLHARTIRRGAARQAAAPLVLLSLAATGGWPNQAPDTS